MVATAIMAVMRGEKLADKDKKTIDAPVCSGRLGELSTEEISDVKKSISKALKYIKSYIGPSKTWFAYQDSLSEGCNRLSVIVSELPVGKQTADILIKTLLKIDDKICRGGVDDSDGTVGGFVEETVIVLKEYAELEPKCAKSFSIL